jgi:hypothetical protein
MQSCEVDYTLGIKTFNFLHILSLSKNNVEMKLGYSQGSHTRKEQNIMCYSGMEAVLFIELINGKFFCIVASSYCGMYTEMPCHTSIITQFHTCRCECMCAHTQTHTRMHIVIPLILTHQTEARLSNIPEYQTVTLLNEDLSNVFCYSSCTSAAH